MRCHYIEAFAKTQFAAGRGSGDIPEAMRRSNYSEDGKDSRVGLRIIVLN